jgi:hypothetical protein
MNGSVSESAKRLSLTALIGLLGFFAGLCTIFTLIVSGIDGWREHAQANWPEATATIERCDVNPTDPYRPVDRDTFWRVQCQLRYRTGTDEIEPILVRAALSLAETSC